MSDKLKVERNCQAVYNRANRVLGMIERIIMYKKIQVALYKTIVRSLVEYCMPAWSPHYKKDEVLIRENST